LRVILCFFGAFAVWLDLKAVVQREWSAANDSVLSAVQVNLVDDVVMTEEDGLYTSWRRHLLNLLVYIIAPLPAQIGLLFLRQKRL